ncbi:MAG: CHRD domain-containing protein [Xanthobacteraceae bacterium]|jgi:hypothetical protein
MNLLIRIITVAAVLGAGLFLVGAASAETITLKADLKSANEIPPNDSTASGTAEATFDTASRTLTWTVSYSGLSGPAIGAHFHGPSEPGKISGIALPFGSANNPIKGSAVLTEAQAADLVAGRWYANIHTARNPGGEIRGQMTR